MWLIDPDTDREISALSARICNPLIDAEALRTAATRHRELCRRHCPVQARRFISPEERYEVIAGQPMQEAESQHVAGGKARWAHLAEQHQVLIDWLAEHGTISTNEIASLYGWTRSHASSKARSLVRQGVLIPVQPEAPDPTRQQSAVYRMRES